MMDAIRNGISVSIKTSRSMNMGVTMDALLYSFTSLNKVLIIRLLLLAALVIALVIALIIAHVITFAVLYFP